MQPAFGAVGAVVLGALAVGVSARRARGRPHRAGPPSIPLLNPPVERLASDLGRLSREMDRIERSDLPAKAFRLKATSLAYDDTLLAACRALDLPAVPASPLLPIQRIEVEAALARSGLRW